MLSLELKSSRPSKKLFLQIYDHSPSVLLVNKLRKQLWAFAGTKHVKKIALFFRYIVSNEKLKNVLCQSSDNLSLESFTAMFPFNLMSTFRL